MPNIDIWDELKTEYIAGGKTLSVLANEHSVSLSSLKKRCAKEKWFHEQEQARLDAKKSLQKARELVLKQESTNRAETLEKIYECAKILIDNVQRCATYSDKSASNLNNAKALRELTAIVRDVKGLQTVTEKQAYELAKRKVDIEEKRHFGGAETENESGIVMIPEVKCE